MISFLKHYSYHYYLFFSYVLFSGFNFSWAAIFLLIVQWILLYYKLFAFNSIPEWILAFYFKPRCNWCAPLFNFFRLDRRDIVQRLGFLSKFFLFCFVHSNFTQFAIKLVPVDAFQIDTHCSNDLNLSWYNKIMRYVIVTTPQVGKKWLRNQNGPKIANWSQPKVDCFRTILSSVVTAFHMGLIYSSYTFMWILMFIIFNSFNLISHRFLSQHQQHRKMYINFRFVHIILINLPNYYRLINNFNEL